MTLIAPSILSANFLNLQQDIEMVNQSEADWFHLDVMDGRFVPNITFGMPLVAAMKKLATKPFDVHLMIVEPEKYFDAFSHAGADILTFHYEAAAHVHRNIQAIKGLGMKAGIALNPATPVSLLQDVISELDMVCLMSVNAGFGGQQFIDQTTFKIRTLRQMIQNSGAHCMIEVDGGITLQNAHAVIKCGADVLVAGNTVFSSPDPKETISNLKGAGLGQDH
jgi:ribulose-phosphate 3-epimerase